MLITNRSERDQYLLRGGSARRRSRHEYHSYQPLHISRVGQSTCELPYFMLLSLCPMLEYHNDVWLYPVNRLDI